MEPYSIDELNQRLLKSKRLMISQGFFYTDFERNGELKTIKAFLPKCDAFFDIGCNKGKVSRAVREADKDIEIHMFDILPRDAVSIPTQSIYNQKALTSPLDTVINEESFITIFTPKAEWHSNAWDSSEIASVAKRTDYNIKDSDFIETKVPSTTLDQYIHQKIDSGKRIFLKIDTEGSEMAILRGGSNTLESRDACGYLEYNPAAWKLADTKNTYKRLYRHMLDIGYTLYRITPLGLKQIPYYCESNENLFCYYFFARKSAIDALEFDSAEVQRKRGLNPSRLLLFNQ